MSEYHVFHHRGLVGLSRAAVAAALAMGAVLSAAIDARAQSDLIPLQQYLDLPADRRNPAYPFIRCAGLHSGLLAYGGANFLPENVRQAENTVSLLVKVAVLVRVRLEGGTVEAVSQDVTSSVSIVSDLYAQR